MPAPDAAAWTLDQADALDWLAGRPPGAADAVITDPPYSSGGRFADATFASDAMDQRVWRKWCREWLGLARAATRPGGYLVGFTDWRQLPAFSDAVQMAGWVWRGTVVWDKGLGARAPNPAHFRHQCEFAVWATNGETCPRRRAAGSGGPWPGCLRHPVRPADKHHPVGKPTALLRDLVACVPAGGLVLDPFAGSGTTGVGAVLEGRRFAGCEVVPAYVRIARGRLAAIPEEIARAL